MKIVCDTNVLVCSAQPDHLLFPETLSAIERILNEGDELVMFLQNMAEYWNTATRPKDKNGLGFSMERTKEELDRLMDSVLVLPITPTHQKPGATWSSNTKSMVSKFMTRAWWLL